MSHNTTNQSTIGAMKKHYETQFRPDVNYQKEVSPDWYKWRRENPEKYSILIDTDSYKVSMWMQYPPETKYISSYIESRGGKYPNTTWFGTQAYVKRLEQNPITADEVEYANGYWTAQGLPFNYGGWMYIVQKHGGKLPVEIRGVDEGTVVPVKNILADAINTDPNVWWLTTWLETSMLRLWYPTTGCTQSWSIKQLINSYFDKFVDADVKPAVLPFRLHDFGARGVNTYEGAQIGGSAHLVNFLGTDTGAAPDWAMINYDARMDPFKEAIPGTGIKVAPGYSIPAAEHSTITSWTRDGEVDAYQNMIDKFAKPGSLVAVVSDSYDFYNALDIWGKQLKEAVIESGATLVVRPDSGDPTVVPVEAIIRLGELYGYTKNSHGYKVLHPSIRVIQGDGINYDSIKAILDSLVANGYSPENIAFGMGGALLQQFNRDTQKFAMKCSAAYIDDKWVDVYKDPITDPGKKSKVGRMSLIIECGLGAVAFKTVRKEDRYGREDLMKVRFLNGSTMNPTTFDEVRHRSENFSNEIESWKPLS